LTLSGRAECESAHDKLAAVKLDEPRSPCVEDPIIQDARPDGEST
jgi:hypothetical protein